VRRKDQLIESDDDYAASFVASWAGAEDEAEILLARASNWKNLFNNDTGFIEARNSDGSWAGENAGWTEGDHWAYSLDVMASQRLITLSY
jgi:putative alpha-1,2-mannosidase